MKTIVFAFLMWFPFPLCGFCVEEVIVDCVISQESPNGAYLLLGFAEPDPRTSGSGFSPTSIKAVLVSINVKEGELKWHLIPELKGATNDIEVRLFGEHIIVMDRSNRRTWVVSDSKSRFIVGLVKRDDFGTPDDAGSFQQIMARLNQSKKPSLFHYPIFEEVLIAPNTHINIESSKSTGYWDKLKISRDEKEVDFPLNIFAKHEFGSIMLFHTSAN